MKRKSCFLLILVTILNLSFVNKPKFGLLTEDYGILTQEDVNKELQLTVPWCWEFNSECIDTNYWQCLVIEDVNYWCNITDLSNSEPMSEPVLQIETQSQVYEFFTRRAYPASLCHKDIEAWEHIIHEEPIVCVSGAFAGIEPQIDEQSGKQKIYWQINLMKSPSGNWSYFNDKEWSTFPR